jgi:hypothetical protein
MKNPTPLLLKKIAVRFAAPAQPIQLSPILVAHTLPAAVCSSFPRRLLARLHPVNRLSPGWPPGCALPSFCRQESGAFLMRRRES